MCLRAKERQSLNRYVIWAVSIAARNLHFPSSPGTSRGQRRIRNSSRYNCRNILSPHQIKYLKRGILKILTLIKHRVIILIYKTISDVSVLKTIIKWKNFSQT